MKFLNGLPYWEVLCRVDRLNSSKRVFERNDNEREGKEAEVVFTDCYDWLVAHGVPIYYDEKPGIWMLRYVKSPSQ